MPKHAGLALRRRRDPHAARRGRHPGRLSDRAFNIARDRVEWLRKGIEASQAKTAAAKAQADKAASAPAPAPVPAPVAASASVTASATAPETAAATDSPSAPVFDIAAIAARCRHA
ncbi:hypothetical protein LP420_30890 [Massilia sp. B-10]|nr:hypothetical protein LP420_30890 [Massilia sp. B-10]